MYASQSFGNPAVVARDFASAAVGIWGSLIPAAFNARNAALFDFQEFLPSTELKVPGALIIHDLLCFLLYASQSSGNPSVVARDLAAVTWVISIPAAFKAANAAPLVFQDFLPSTELNVLGALIIHDLLSPLLCASQFLGNPTVVARDFASATARATAGDTFSTSSSSSPLNVQHGRTDVPSPPSSFCPSVSQSLCFLFILIVGILQLGCFISHKQMARVQV